MSELSNQILGGANLAACQASLRANIAAARALGFSDVVICSVMAREDVTGAAETVRQAVNSWLASGWAAEGITKLVNFHTATAIDGQSCPASLLDPSNRTYFDGAGVHMTSTGLPIWANQWGVRLVEIGY
jgi:hypothetical protein